jgi:zinc protease
LSRLFQRLREKAGLAYHASSQLEAMRYGGFWTVQAGTSPANADRALRLLRRELRHLESDPVAPDELELIRESAIGELPLSLESTADAHELAVDLAYHELPADFWERWPARLRAVGPAEIQEAVREGLDARTAVTIVAGPAPRAR